ncbi:MAG: hypothetical protein ACK5XN_20510 [Bacteroidota bacterium]
MLPLIYHLQKVSFHYDSLFYQFFVIAEHPQHAREIVAEHYYELDEDSKKDIELVILLSSSVQFIATLANNPNIIPCVLEV